METSETSQCECQGPAKCTSITGRLHRWLLQLPLSGGTALAIAAIAVGLAGGAGAVLVRYLIHACEQLFLHTLANALSFLGPFKFIVPPMVGGLLVGPMICFIAREAKGHGVPEVMEAIALSGARIRARVAVIKAIASSICIGSGGSAGREGPMVQIGSGIGSTLGQLLRLPESRIGTLVACGAAAGIAAAFNAPLAGVMFALEVIQGEFTAEAFGVIVLSSVSAAAVAQSVFGKSVAFPIPKYELASVTELPLFALLGLVAGVAAVGYTLLIYRVEDSFDRIRSIPEWVKASIGGAMVGLLGVLTVMGGDRNPDGVPGIFGVGYGAIEQVLLPTATIGLTLIWLVGKPLATALTLGSGGSGGIFAPALFIGAMLGAIFGNSVHSVMAPTTTSPGGYALVGMGALFAGAAHAPFTSILIMFELTDDYRMILPLMAACVLSTIVAKRLLRDSIYTLKLTRRGVHFSLGRDINLMNELQVKDAMTTDLITVTCGTPVREVAQLLQNTKHHGFPLVDGKGELHGIVTLQDIREAMRTRQADAPVEQVATHTLVVAHPTESLNEALRKLGLRDVGRLPVVDEKNPKKLLGLVTRKNIISAYNRELLKHHASLTIKDVETFD